MNRKWNNGPEFSINPIRFIVITLTCVPVDTNWFLGINCTTDNIATAGNHRMFWWMCFDNLILTPVFTSSTMAYYNLDFSQNTRELWFLLSLQYKIYGIHILVLSRYLEIAGRRRKKMSPIKIRSQSQLQLFSIC